MVAAAAPIERPAATRGRVALFFAVRYLTPLMVLLALAASGEQPAMEQLAGLLTIQVVVAVLGHAFALRGTLQTNVALWTGMLADLTMISMLVALTGGPGGPLWFLYLIQALAAGILLSSRAGVRVLALSSTAILAMDAIAFADAPAGTSALPPGLVIVAVLWIVGGAGTLFSTYNERELRRRNAELSTIRQVTLDIEQSLTLGEIFQDLCRGVCKGFGFDSATVLLREEQQMRCVAAHGVSGSTELTLPMAGRLAHALAVAGPVVTNGEHARRDGVLVPLIGPRGYLAVPIAEDGLLIVTRDGRKGRGGVLHSHEIETLDRLAHHARLAIGNARLHQRVREMAVTDSLTGLLNHGEMQRRLEAEVGRLQRYATLNDESHSLSLVLLDIDHFKDFNDRYGHQAGDAVLRGVATALGSAVRGFDVIARYGGEEFAVILPETPADAAEVVAERLRRAVAAYPFATKVGQKPVRVTVSVGVATSPENGRSSDELIRAADLALYAAKDGGRDQVVHAIEVLGEGAQVLTMEATRRRRERGGDRAPSASQRARGRSSRPRRRTPHA